MTAARESSLSIARDAHGDTSRVRSLAVGFQSRELRVYRNARIDIVQISAAKGARTDRRRVGELRIKATACSQRVWMFVLINCSAEYMGVCLDYFCA